MLGYFLEFQESKERTDIFRFNLYNILSLVLVVTADMCELEIRSLD